MVFSDDPILNVLIQEAQADPDVIGLILSGSRGAGALHPESDYDLCFVVTNEAYDRYHLPGQWPVRDSTIDLPVKRDIWHECPRTLSRAHQPEWEIVGYAESHVMLDKTGETARLLEELITLPEEEARKNTAAAYDGYLNALYRSLKAWRRGNDLGGRMQAAEGAQLLLNTLFLLERRRRPYHDRLWLNLNALAGQGWQPGELRAILLDLISTGDPRRQQELARERIVPLMRERGYHEVYDGWEGQIDEILAWEFV